ncbi:class I glutamine amidotransferase-like protein [Lentithecium fluviatile CBS 122367]|uniref:Class I glutamine amidotransferase-like protein n=1 Tax=Lentithecium fluviatile CBS 122367 TaxID=1168545 RepID=A0A6G1IR85_9PLEO|nr:class I glutamine amidotransferase-like protein [Lentithecium fluviatile CBS 122367]
MPPTFNVAVLLYPSADILDFSGPIEIYSTLPPPPTAPPFTITTFAQVNPLHAENSVLVYIPAKSFSKVSAELEQYDILVVPGAHPDVLTKLIQSEQGKEITNLIKRFVGLKPREETGKRVLQSVCTGSLLLAASGVLAGRTCTGHHMSYDAIKTIADRAAGGDSKVNVVQKRWVDAGMTEAGVRIVNAGGVSSGIDASLWVVEELLGKERAGWVAEVVEFERRGEGEAWVVGKA